MTRNSYSVSSYGEGWVAEGYPEPMTESQCSELVHSGMDEIELRSLITLLACADKPGLIPDEDRNTLENYADKRSRYFGFTDWIKALHKL